MEDRYKTVAREMITKCKIQRSLFIAHVKEAAGEGEAREFIAQVSQEHKQATHNCSAFRVGRGDEEISYYDDDGEPSGTAGKPIYGAILTREITNVVLVVTRYFGGKKLGVRGLIEAYGAAAGDAIDHAGIITRVYLETLSLTCGYPQLDQVNHLLDRVQAQVLDTAYGTEVKMRVAVPRSQKKELQGLLAKLGQVKG